MSTIDFVTSLRAIATHIKKHELNNSGLLSVRADKYDGIDVNVYGRDACRSWLSTLSNTSAAAHVYASDRIHVEATGGVGGMRVKLTYVVVADQDPEVYAALLALVPHLEPGQTGQLELPEILTGGDW